MKLLVDYVICFACIEVPHIRHCLWFWSS